MNVSLGMKPKLETQTVVGAAMVLLVLLPMVAVPYQTGYSMTSWQQLGKPVVVQVGNSAAVMTAVETLQRFMQDVRVVQISSLAELELQLLTQTALFIVGHGTPEGLATTPTGENVVLSWSVLNALQQTYIGAKLYVIACNALTYLQLAKVSLQRVSFAPAMPIDAEIGAMMALVQFALDFNLPLTLVFGLAFHLLGLVLGKASSDYQLLGYFSSEEMLWWALKFTLDVILGVFSYFIPWSFIRYVFDEISFWSVASAVYTLANNLLAVYYGYKSLTDAILDTAWAILDILDALRDLAWQYALDYGRWDFYVQFAAFVAFIVGMSAFSAGSYLVAHIASIVGALLADVAGLARDYYDSDGTAEIFE